jgi:Arc-like DNA binding domain
MAKKTKEAPHLRVRIDPIRLARLEKAAETNGRTLTGEIVHRLDESFRRLDVTSNLETLSDEIAAKVVAALKGEKK